MIICFSHHHTTYRYCSPDFLSVLDAMTKQLQLLVLAALILLEFGSTRILKKLIKNSTPFLNLVADYYGSEVWNAQQL